MNFISYLFYLQMPIFAFGNNPDVVYIQGGWITLGYTEKITNTYIEKWVPEPMLSQPHLREKKQIEVKVSSFYLSRYEVTNQEYCNFLNEERNSGENESCWLCLERTQECRSICKIRLINGKYRPEPGFEDHPVICVTWYGAKAYCDWAGGRLPTSAEWEYAARGGQKLKEYIFSGSDNCEEVAVFNTNAPKKKGSKKPNELGLYDMSGNVQEWCQDWYAHEYHKYYNMPDKINPKGPAEGEVKVMRGGNWQNLQDLFLQTPKISASKPHRTSATVGFRVCYDKI